MNNVTKIVTIEDQKFEIRIEKDNRYYIVGLLRNEDKKLIYTYGKIVECNDYDLPETFYIDLCKEICDMYIEHSGIKIEKRNGERLKKLEEWDGIIK